MICPNCSSENRPGAKFCDECGTRLPIDFQIDSVEEAFGTAEELNSRFGELPEIPYEPQEAGEEAEEPLVSAEVPAEEGGEVEMEAEDAPVEEEPEETVQEEPATEAASSDKTVDFRSLRSADETQVIELPPIDDMYVGLEESSIDELAALTAWEKGGTMKMQPVEAPDSDKSAQRRFVSNKDDVAPVRSKKPVAIALVAALLAVLIAFGTWYFELWGGVKVPDVRSLSQDNAASVLRDKGFSVRSELVKSDDEEGIVLLTDPQAGSRMSEGGEVVLHVSVGRQIPEIVGMSEQEAKKLVDAEGFENVTYAKEKSNEPEGIVISVNPLPGTKAKGAQAITVTVTEAYVVPDVAGKDSGSATIALEDEGYYVVYARSYTEGVTEGTVVSTDPEGGTKYNSGETVVVYVATSRSRELIEAANSLMAPGGSVVLDGVNFSINSVSGIDYLGDDATSFTVSGRPYVYLFGQTVYGDVATVSGTVHWTSDNDVSYISIG